MQQLDWRWLEETKVCILRTCALELRLQKGKKPKANQQKKLPKARYLTGLSSEFHPHSNLIWGWGLEVMSGQVSGVGKEIKCLSTWQLHMRRRWWVRLDSPYPLSLPMKALSHLKHHSALPRLLGRLHSDGNHWPPDALHEDAPSWALLLKSLVALE